MYVKKKKKFKANWATWSEGIFLRERSCSGTLGRRWARSGTRFVSIAAFLKFGRRKYLPKLDGSKAMKKQYNK